MNAPPNLSQIEQLRARDGERCWLCDGKLSFNAPPNSKKAPTREHLVAQSLGGRDALDNLVLCHPGCNTHLGSRPKADKVKMREKRIASRAKQAVLAKPLPKAISAKPLMMKGNPPAPSPKTPATDWQRTAMVAIASAIFFAALSLGMLIG